MLEYFDIIWHALRPGGYFINLGPLLYHWQAAAVEEEETGSEIDPRYTQSVELSYQEVRFALCARGFVLLKEAKAAKTTYGGNRMSLLSSVYSPLLWVAQKPLDSKGS